MKWGIQARFQRDRNYKKENNENIVKGDKTRFNDGPCVNTFIFAWGWGNQTIIEEWNKVSKQALLCNSALPAGA